MSGYLLRLAASVRNPGGEIHPALGSIFSPSQYQPGAEDGLEQSSFRTPERETYGPGIQQDAGTVTMMRPQHRSKADPDPSIAGVPFRASQIPLAGAPEKVQDTQGLDPAPVEERSYQPIVSAKNRADIAPRAGPSESVISQADETRPLTGPFEINPADSPPATRIPVRPTPHPSSEKLAEDGVPFETLTAEVAFPKPETPKVTPSIARPDRYRPLLAEQVPRMEERTSTAIPKGAQKKETRHFPGLEAAERQPDEIQIRIGRIEVVAVPPVPVRAAPKPANKSPNLSDYLKLRHGRA